jgi:hypothetical protein
MGHLITMNNAAAFGLVVGQQRTIRIKGDKPYRGTITDLIPEHASSANLSGVVLTDADGDIAAIPADAIAAVLTITSTTR